MPDVVIPVHPSGAGSWLHRQHQTAPGEYAPEVYARDAWSAAIGNGQGYLVGSGRVELSVAGNVRALISNPASNANGNPDGSHRIVTVVGLSAFGTGTAWADIYENPTAGLPTTAIRPRWRMNSAVGDAGTVEVRVDTSATTALSGGADTGMVLGLPNGNRSDIRPIGKVILPGQSIGVNVPFAGAASEAFNLYIVEE
jgi:hypothetical protein